MPHPPDLTLLSHAQKDELILMLWPLQQQIPELMAQMAVMQERIKQLEGRLALNSRNSSKPPSSEGLNKPAPKSLRASGQNTSGGQKGHPGNTLRKATQPDKIVVHAVPDVCQACHDKLPFAYVAETRQVFDLPQVKYEITEHRAMQSICKCGQVHTGQFPATVSAGVQYGPRAQAAMVHLNQNHAVSVQRTAALMKDFFELPVSQATVLKAVQVGAELLLPTVEDIGQAIAAAAVAHADESGLRVSKKLHWLHVLATDSRFMTQAGVPFTNNLAEHSVRMPKVKQKVSGSFRTLQGANNYCVIRSYCATMQKQGANIFEALSATFSGQTPRPLLV